jgi:hypothetical protein
VEMSTGGMPSISDETAQGEVTLLDVVNHTMSTTSSVVASSLLDVLRLEIRDVHVLDDDITRAADDTQTLALGDSAASRANKRPIRPDCDAHDTSSVVVNRDIWCTRLVVLAPAVLVDGDLIGGAPCSHGCAFCAVEAES